MKSFLFFRASLRARSSRCGRMSSSFTAKLQYPGKEMWNQKYIRQHSNVQWGREGGGKGDAPPCDLSHDVFDVTPTPHKQTDACENSTFPKLRLRMVNMPEPKGSDQIQHMASISHLWTETNCWLNYCNYVNYSHQFQFT